MLKNRAINVLTSLTGIGMILNVFYYLLQVHFFGITRNIENYFIALGLYALGLSFTIVGHISQYALPIYLEKKKSGGDQLGDQIFSIIFNWVFLKSTLITFILFVSASFLVELVTPGFKSSDQIIIKSLFQLLLLAIPFQVFNILSNSLLNANKVYGKLELMNIIRILLSIGLLVLLQEKLGIYSLIVCFWMDIIINFLVNAIFLYVRKFQYVFSWSSSGFDHNSFFKKTAIAYLHNGTKQLYSIMLTISISYLSIGVFAIYKYIESIYAKISALVLMPVSTVFFTKFADDYSNNSKQLNQQISKTIEYGFIFSGFIIIFGVSFRSDLLHFLWGENYPFNMESIAFFYFIISLFTLIFHTIQGVLFKVALVYNKIVNIYIGLSISWLMSAVYASFIIPLFQEWGLGTLIIFTPLIMSLISFLVVYQNDKDICSIFNISSLYRISAVVIVSLCVGFFINKLPVPNLEIGLRLNILFSLSIKSIILLIVIFIQLKINRLINLFS